MVQVDLRGADRRPQSFSITFVQCHHGHHVVLVIPGVMFRHIKRFKELRPGRRTGDPEQGRRLWTLSEQLIRRARAVRLASEAPAAAAS